MFFFLISSLPFFVLLFSSFPLKSLPSWALDVRSLCILFWREIASLSLKGFALTCCQFFCNSSSMACKKHGSGADNAEPSMETSLLDLPELALECILEKLPPSGLCSMASVCSSLKDRCRSDYLWERHMREKWGKVIGTAARKEWQWYLATRKDSSCSGAEGAKSRLMGSLACLWPLSWLKSTIDGGSQPISPRRDDSIMSWYLSLESGKFWFPAQVYNREHGHVGFMLSCYDAELCYDSRTDTFQARYPPHGRRTVVVEDGVQWERLRAPPVETSAHDLHVSDCLSDLRPGDHIEIQWRRNKEFPYGWWYGVVGHLDSCDGNEHFCRCSSNESLILEFHQYTPGSRWRQTTINRKEHQEEGNETDGFYGGIRKIYGKDEISAWRRLWPTEIFE